jgi:two-component system, sensor histidine kinase and response regulator
MLALPMTKKNRILVVDDLVDNLLLLESILETNYELVLVQNGFAALEAIVQMPPDLILLDIMMPDLDGFELTRRIRSQKDLSFIPILLITADDRASLIRGLDSGADDFIRKPLDIGELLARVRSLLRLKQSIDELEEMAKIREDFVSRLTHDLRTPLFAAERMLGLLQGGNVEQLSPQMEEIVQIMARSNRNLLDMVNNLLEVYRYEAQSKILAFTAVDLPKLLLEVVRELTLLAREKNLVLNYSPIATDEIIVNGDYLELRRVFTNLIGNGIKYTDAGSIDLCWQVSPPYVICRITDTGCGIPPEDFPALFDRFRQGKNHRFGSGLGLYLSQQIILAHQGSIAVNSELGKGSEFSVYLPLLQ